VTSSAEPAQTRVGFSRLLGRGDGAADHPVLRAIVRRLVISIPLLFVVSALTFVLVSLIPGDAARQILGAGAPNDEYEALRHALGLDRPLYSQYWQWLHRAITGDLGASVFSGERVVHAIDVRLPVTLSLIGGSLLVSVTFGVALGVFSAIRGGALGRAVDAFALAGFALPAFWLGAELIVLFAVKVRWFPATGYTPLAESFSGWLRSITLPVVALGLGATASIAKQTRQAMLDALSSEYIRMAWANGLSPRSVVFRHALKNAAIPVVTVTGIQAINLLGGTVLIENVFALPGLGGLTVSAVTQHDLPTVEGLVVYFTILVVAINFLTDIAYSWLNPRIRTS
jgi:peptide/nickel transport system permease protein